MADLNKSQATDVARTREKVRWVGEAHHAAMMVIREEAVSSRAAKKPLPKAGSHEYCKLLEKAGKAAIRILDKARPIVRTDTDHANDLRAVPDLDKCLNGSSQYVAPNPLHLANRQLTEDSEPVVTGAYESYLDLMEQQVGSSDWSVAGVSGAVNDVLATAIANGIPEGDLLALASFAELSESSAIEWNSYNWDSLIGGGSSCSGARCLTSFFGHSSMRGKLGTIISADIAGCLSSVRSWSALQVLLYMPAWKALAGRCGVRGAIGSGMAVMAFL